MEEKHSDAKLSKENSSDPLPLSAPAETLNITTVLAHGGSKISEGFWSETIFLAHDAILTASANAEGRFNIRKLPEPRPETAPAGISVRIEVDGQTVAANQSFEAQATKMTFFASASFSGFLPKGHHSLSVARVDKGVNGSQSLGVTYHAVPVRLPDED